MKVPERGSRSPRSSALRPPPFILCVDANVRGSWERGSLPSAPISSPAECISEIRWGFPCGSAGKEPSRSAGDLGLIPGLGRSPGEGKGYPFQCSGLENSTDCIVHGVAKTQTRLSDFHSLTLCPKQHLLIDPWCPAF